MKLIKFQRPLFLNELPGVSRWMDFDSDFDRLIGSLQTGFSPALDVHENKENVIVRAELPGLSKEDVQVTVLDGCLTITGERKHETAAEDSTAHLSERRFGRFERTLTLPVAIDVAKIKAEYKDGILTVTLPKAEEAKPKQITVTVN